MTLSQHEIKCFINTTPIMLHTSVPLKTFTWAWSKMVLYTSSSHLFYLLTQDSHIHQINWLVKPTRCRRVIIHIYIYIYIYIYILWCSSLQMEPFYQLRQIKFTPFKCNKTKCLDINQASNNFNRTPVQLQSYNLT